ncbi:MAG: phosphoribosylglycinamide formyltransferase, partial [Myxococcales bacterium]|nr:phosphoribosylglycinamide formyltransferase [Myxococcales bacterium]
WRPAVVLDHKGFGDRESFDAAVVRQLRDDQVDLVVLAGFMRIVTSTLIQAFRNRIINIHPSLLPAFPGIDAQRRALDAGVRIAGCTVHIVDEGVDSGAILGQAAVPVLRSDDVASLSARILEAEHLLLPAVVRAIAEQKLDLDAARPALNHDLDAAPEAMLSSVRTEGAA